MKRKFSFPRKEPRFAPWLFSLSWEQRKLGEITSSYSGGTPSAGNKEFYVGQIPFIRSGEIHSSSTELFINNRALDSSSAKLVKKGDILYALYGATSGEVSRAQLDGAINQAILAIIPTSGQDADFIVEWLRKEKQNIISTYLQGGQGNLSAQIVKELLISIARPEEQQKIGRVFRKINDLITLHQRGANSWVRVRFRRFCSTTIFWEQRKAKDLCFISTGKSNTQDSIEDGTYPFYVRSPIVEKSNRFLFDEEAVLTVGDGVGTGKVFHYVNGKYDLHQRVYRMFGFTDDISAKFFYYFFSTHFYDRVMSMTAKTSVDSVRLEMIADMDIQYPKVREQKAISNFFDGLNYLITLHQCKLRMLSKLRKMQILPENALLRRRKTTAWEQRKLGELCSITTGRLDANAMIDGGKYDFYTSGVEKYRIDVAAFEGPAITIAGNGANVGYLHLADGKFNAYQRTYVLTDFQADRQFLSSVIGQALPLKIQEEVRGSGIPYIVMDMLTELSVPLPKEGEQSKVGQLFKEVDTLITLHQRKLELVKNRVRTAFWRTSLNNYDGCPLRLTFAWEQRKVSEIGSLSKGTGYSKSDIRDKGTPLILYGRLYTKYETVIRDVDTFTTPKDGSVYSRGGEVIIPASGETAEDISIASVVEKSGVILGGDLNIVTPQSGIDSAFLALSISHGEAHRSLSKLAQGKSVVHIHNSDIQTVEVGIPVQAEQESISQFFEGVDRLITLHQREFTHTNPNTNYVKYYQRNRPLLCVLRSMDKSV